MAQENRIKGASQATKDKTGCIEVKDISGNERGLRNVTLRDEDALDIVKRNVV
jgi:hypothetical protein